MINRGRPANSTPETAAGDVVGVNRDTLRRLVAAGAIPHPTEVFNAHGRCVGRYYQDSDLADLRDRIEAGEVPIGHRTVAKGHSPADRARCGTYSGYFSHRNREEPACEPCLKAMRDYKNAQNAARRRAS